MENEVACFTNSEDNMQSKVYRLADKFSVILTDLDSGKVAEVIWFPFSLVNAESRAVACAESVL